MFIMRQTSYIPRPVFDSKIKQFLEESPTVILLGARQVGKTTLARRFSDGLDKVHYFDLERAASRAALSTPELTLSELSGTVVIDEIQRMPQLFETLRPLCDRPGNPARFLLLGSASPDIVKGVSESLAGRALFINVPGFSLGEVGNDSQNPLWLRGAFPRSFLAPNDDASMRWREAFVQTFLERDMPLLGVRTPPERLRRFWMMVSHYHGAVWNGSEIARSVGVSLPTIRHYLDILAGGYILRVLPPWFENIKKRQVKSPKVYIRDTGLLHSMLGIDSMAALRSHPSYGASWEGFALEQILILFGHPNACYWRTHRGAELDLMIFHKGKRLGFEFKCADAPVMTRSMHTALRDLKLDRLHVIYPGSKSYPIHEKAHATPLSRAAALLPRGNFTPGAFPPSKNKKDPKKKEDNP
ncbi:conserved hypothetical protein [Candidatus Desulfarcum epimagneticum]|uniref:AAA+ ATPase domain-containing protein n=1 Tax=uncultured Desulfobacteraceae bacterium TaxID=218296 RepID=A0A484HIC3_9BACT|nr:conserved hypothetical protein [uncultured Desulfobacteraceae bacterium]